MIPARRKKVLAILFSVILLDLVGFALLVPTIPLLAKSLGASGKMLGLIIGSYTAAQFIFAHFWGALSDRIGRKSVLMISIIGAGLAMILLGFAKTFSMILLARVLGGMFAANIGVASAYIADITPIEDRTKSMGLIGVAFGMGFLLGPTIGGLLIKYGYSVPIFTTAGLNFFNAIYAYFVLPKDNLTEHVKKSLSPWQILAHRPILIICMANFLFIFATTQLETTFTFYVKQVFDLPNQYIYHIFALMALLMILIQGGLIRRLTPYVSDQALMLTGSVILSIGFLLLPMAGNIKIMIFPLILCSLGRGLAQPALTGMASKSMDVHVIGAVMGVFTASANLARCLGQFSGGFLFDLKPSYPFIAAALLMVGAAIIIRFKQSNLKIDSI